MAYRVEELAARADTSVDTIRYYQARDLLPAPTHVGRIAWYGEEHVERLARIRHLQGRGFSLAVIRRTLAGELDHADEELIAAMAGQFENAPRTAPPVPPREAGAEWMTLDQLAVRSGIPLAVLDALRRERILIPNRVAGEERYSDADLAAGAAGLRLLEQGLPLPDLLDLARAHDAAVRATAERAVQLFDVHVRQAVRAAGESDEVAAQRLVAAFEEMLPATMTLVTHHFRRTLLAVAQDHIERVGTAVATAAVRSA
ncbi:MAG: helix-turn-helix domain-containing protein [Acidimicrobiales bacterium]